MTQLEHNNRNAVYIAAASAELERYEAAVALAESLGLFVVGKWGEAIVPHGSQGNDLEVDERRARSRDIRRAISQCRGFVLLQPPPHVATRGAFWECGYAEGLGASRQLTGQPWPLWSFHVGLTRDTPPEPPITLRVRDGAVETVVNANAHPHRDFILVGEDAWAFHANDAEAIRSCAYELLEGLGKWSMWDVWLEGREGPPDIVNIGGRTFEAAWWFTYNFLGHDRFTLRRGTLR